MGTFYRLSGAKLQNENEFYQQQRKASANYIDVLSMVQDHDDHTRIGSVPTILFYNWLCVFIFIIGFAAYMVQLRLWRVAAKECNDRSNADIVEKLFIKEPKIDESEVRRNELNILLRDEYSSDTD